MTYIYYPMGFPEGTTESTYTAQRSYLSCSDRASIARMYSYDYNPLKDYTLPWSFDLNLQTYKK